MATIDRSRKSRRFRASPLGGKNETSAEAVMARPHSFEADAVGRIPDPSGLAVH
jgi:hypothetical protein